MGVGVLPPHPTPLHTNGEDGEDGIVVSLHVMVFVCGSWQTCMCGHLFFFFPFSG
jgi:hypothetical protein